MDSRIASAIPSDSEACTNTSDAENTTDLAISSTNPSHRTDDSKPNCATKASNCDTYFPALRPPAMISRDSGLLARTSSKARIIRWMLDRKSTRLNSSHLVISYAVFCLKKKKLVLPPELLDVHISHAH